tara:strand:+ start:247 stop:2652 length:2406 start_codon:yes stop_codon:yes gene_type:complete
MATYRIDETAQPVYRPQGGGSGSNTGSIFSALSQLSAAKQRNKYYDYLNEAQKQKLGAAEMMHRESAIKERQNNKLYDQTLDNYKDILIDNRNKYNSIIQYLDKHLSIGNMSPQEYQEWKKSAIASTTPNGDVVYNQLPKANTGPNTPSSKKLAIYKSLLESPEFKEWEKTGNIEEGVELPSTIFARRLSNAIYSAESFEKSDSEIVKEIQKIPGVQTVRRMQPTVKDPNTGRDTGLTAAGTPPSTVIDYIHNPSRDQNIFYKNAYGRNPVTGRAITADSADDIDVTSPSRLPSTRRDRSNIPVTDPRYITPLREAQTTQTPVVSEAPPQPAQPVPLNQISQEEIPEEVRQSPYYGTEEIPLSPDTLPQAVTGAPSRREAMLSASENQPTTINQGNMNYVPYDSYPQQTYRDRLAEVNQIIADKQKESFIDPETGESVKPYGTVGIRGSMLDPNKILPFYNIDAYKRERDELQRLLGVTPNNLEATLESPMSQTPQVPELKFDDNQEPVVEGPSELPVFDPEGSGYDYDTAKQVGGMFSSPDGRWYSTVPSGQSAGMILKGTGNPTYDNTVQGETGVGNVITQGADGRYYATPETLPNVGSPSGLMEMDGASMPAYLPPTGAPSRGQAMMASPNNPPAVQGNTPIRLDQLQQPVEDVSYLPEGSYSDPYMEEMREVMRQLEMQGESIPPFYAKGVSSEGALMPLSDPRYLPPMVDRSFPQMGPVRQQTADPVELNTFGGNTISRRMLPNYNTINQNPLLMEMDGTIPYGEPALYGEEPPAEISPEDLEALQLMYPDVEYTD